MADEKKEKKIVSASTGKVVTDSKSEARRKAAADTVAAVKTEKKADARKAEAEAEAASGKKTKKQRATGLRVVAFILWALAIAAEVIAILILNGTIYTGDQLTIWLIAALAVDLVLVIIGSQLWKKANHIDPASEKDKVKFWLWNNMGVIISVIAFLPIIILILRNNDIDPKIKKLAGIVAVAALVVAALASYDWNPASEESLAEANDQIDSIGADTVYWTPFGQKYHIDSDCSSLSRSNTVYAGSVDEAFEANRVDLCKICAKAYGIDPDNPAISTANNGAVDDADITDDANVEDEGLDEAA